MTTSPNMIASKASAQQEADFAGAGSFMMQEIASPFTRRSAPAACVSSRHASISSLPDIQFVCEAVLQEEAEIWGPPAPRSRMGSSIGYADAHQFAHGSHHTAMVSDHCQPGQQHQAHQGTHVPTTSADFALAGASLDTTLHHQSHSSQTHHSRTMPCPTFQPTSHRSVPPNNSVPQFSSQSLPLQPSRQSWTEHPSSQSPTAQSSKQAWSDLAASQSIAVQPCRQSGTDQPSASHQSLSNQPSNSSTASVLQSQPPGTKPRRKLSIHTRPASKSGNQQTDNSWLQPEAGRSSPTAAESAGSSSGMGRPYCKSPDAGKFDPDNYCPPDIIFVYPKHAPRSISAWLMGLLGISACYAVEEEKESRWIGPGRSSRVPSKSILRPSQSGNEVSSTPLFVSDSATSYTATPSTRHVTLCNSLPTTQDSPSRALPSVESLRASSKAVRFSGSGRVCCDGDPLTSRASGFGRMSWQQL